MFSSFTCQCNIRRLDEGYLLHTVFHLQQLSLLARFHLPSTRCSTVGWLRTNSYVIFLFQIISASTLILKKLHVNRLIVSFRLPEPVRKLLEAVQVISWFTIWVNTSSINKSILVITTWHEHVGRNIIRTIVWIQRSVS